MNRILDACAMIAFLKDEPGAEAVHAILRDPSSNCFAHSVNLCEVYCNFLRTNNRPAARHALRDLTRIGVRTRRDMGKDLWLRVGELKHTVRKISLADCFALALAEKLDADVVTSDHQEFDPIVAANLARVTFIR
jgi:PIN domain nuclease of toxin-antitoxin system